VGETTLSPAQLTARAVVADLDRRLAHVLETGMRRHLVLDALLAAGPEATSAVLGEVERRPPSGERMVADRLRETLHDVLLGADPDCALPYEMRRDVYAAAGAAGDEAVMALLRSLPAREGPEQPRLPKELADIPLGRRRSLARGEDRRLLELLARDLDPIVIGHLLENPRLVEADVVHMAAMRPALASTLEEIFRSRRWSSRQRVRVALARNPYCPPAIATRLVSALPLPELREMRDDPHLQGPTRAYVEQELARRSPES
jgi:hypothetical protein